MAPSSRFGDFFKAKRIALGVTLRQFCLEGGLDAGNLSRLERGMIPPPRSREKLEDYAKLLHLKQDSDDWMTFFDLAAAEAGRIPQDLLNDEEVLEKLPILFRTLRGQKVSEEQLDDLVKKLKRG